MYIRDRSAEVNRFFARMIFPHLVREHNIIDHTCTTQNILVININSTRKCRLYTDFSFVRLDELSE